MFVPPPPPSLKVPLWATYCPERTTKQAFVAHNSIGQAKSALRAQIYYKRDERDLSRYIEVGVHKSGWNAGAPRKEYEHMILRGALYVRANDEWQLVHVIQDKTWPSECIIWQMKEAALKEVRYES